MSSDSIPIAVQRLLAERLRSVAQLEALLLLHALAAPFAQPPGDAPTAPDIRGARDAHAVANALRIAERWAEQILDELVRAGLITTIDDPQGNRRLYRFCVEDAPLRAAVEELRAVYAERRVSVIAMLFSKPPSPVTSFADAFRLRQERPPNTPPAQPPNTPLPRTPDPSAPPGRAQDTGSPPDA